MVLRGLYLASCAMRICGSARFASGSRKFERDSASCVSGFTPRSNHWMGSEKSIASWYGVPSLAPPATTQAPRRGADHGPLGLSPVLVRVSAGHDNGVRYASTEHGGQRVALRRG